MGTRKGRQLTLRSAKRALSRRLLRHAGVAGVGIAEAADGSERITVYLAEDSAPLRALVPTAVEGFPVAVEVIGQVSARAVPGGAALAGGAHD